MKFKTGQVVATPNALDAIEKAGDNINNYFIRHVQGDWGVVSEDDKKANDEALEDGSRLFSAYILKDGKTKIWIITESDRSATTVLLPEDY